MEFGVGAANFSRVIGSLDRVHDEVTERSRVKDGRGLNRQLFKKVINEAFVENARTLAFLGAGRVAASPRRQRTSKPEADRVSDRMVPSSPVD